MMRKLVLLLLTIPALCGILQAEVKLELQVPAESLVLGDEITLQLKADGVEGDAKLGLPEVPGLSFRQLGPPSSSSQTIIINGRMERFSGLVFSIGVSGLKKGAYEVPGFTLSYNGRDYRSRSFGLRVVSPDAQTSMRVVVAVSQASVYQHEPLLITLKWYLQDSVQEYSFRFPLLEQKDRLQLQLADIPGTAATRELTVSGYNVPFRQGQETLDREVYTVYETTLQVYPPDAGMFQVPAASVKAVVQRGTELKRDFFDRLVQAPRLQRIFAVSEPVAIQVKELPASGRPRWFTGAVGRFDVQISTGQTRVRTGDPVELTIRISGKGKFSAIGQPVLNDIPGYREQFVIVDSLEPGDVADGSITFRQVIRPRAESVSQIPPVRFSYFDPEQERYVTIDSNSVALKVLPVKQITAADIIKPDEPAPVEKNGALEKKQGIYGNYTFEDALTSQERHPAWFLVFLLPPAGYLALLLLVRRRRRLSSDLALVRSRAAMGKSMKRLKRIRRLISADSRIFLGEVNNLLSGYIADKFNLGAGEVTGIDVRRLAENQRLPWQTAEELVELLETFDRLRFSNTEVSPAERQNIMAAVEKRIRQLDREL